jgi:hypothetical protein
MLSTDQATDAGRMAAEMRGMAGWFTQHQRPVTASLPATPRVFFLARGGEGYGRLGSVKKDQQSARAGCRLDGGRLSNGGLSMGDNDDDELRLGSFPLSDGRPKRVG